MPFKEYLPIICKDFRREGGRAMAIVVKCESCKTDFRLNEALLKGAKGASIRCPKCRERFIVENPHPPPVVHPTAPPDPVSDPSDISGGKALRLEDLFIPPSAVEGDRIPDRENFGRMVIRPPGSGWKPPPRRPLYRRPLFLAAMISILLLAGGTFYFVDGNSSPKSSESVLPARARSIRENAVLDVGNLKGYLNRKPSGETFYVVKGTVTNIGKALSSGIRVEATLLGNDNQAIANNGTFAGNVIDDSLIPHMSRFRIETYLGTRHGEGDVNRDIPAGKSLPFLVVFFDPPEGVESFRVKAIGAEEADRIVSPDGKKPGTGASNPQ